MTANVKQPKVQETRQVSQKTVDNPIHRFIVQGLQASSLVDQPSFQTLILDKHCCDVSNYSLP